VGLNACDHLCLIPKFPDRGAKLQVSKLVTCGGGQAATASCCLARLGHRVAYAGVCGDDGPGRQARPWLEEFRVNPAGLITKPGSTSQQAFILVEEKGGERTIIWHRDESCRLEPEDLDPDLIASSRVLHLDGHFLEANLEAARIARKHGVLVSLDGEKVYPGTEKLVGMCQVVVGCSDFAQRLTGTSDPGKALRQMAALGPLWAGRTKGPQGAEMIVEGNLFEHPGFAVTAVDTTGAGDVFHAGMVHALLLGQTPSQALATAAAVAAISVTSLGGRSALPDRSQLQAFLSRQKP
jgi:sugar/nucleoside kinase (ribokinase family)